MLVSIRTSQKYLLVTLLVFLLHIGTIQLIKPAIALTGIKTDSDPSSIVIDPISNRTYVANQRSNTISIIGDSGKVINRINTGSLPISLAIKSDLSSLYVANAKANAVSVIDISTNKVIDNILVGTYPYSLAIGVGDRLLVANSQSNDLSIITLANDNVTDTIHVGLYPTAAAFDSNGKTGKIYVTNAGDNTVSVITLPRCPGCHGYNITNTITGFNRPYALAVDTAENKIYVTNVNASTVSIIDGTTDEVLRNIHVGKYPSSISVNNYTNKVYVANYGSHSISIIDGDTYNVENITLNDRNAKPNYVTVYPLSKFKSEVYVANAGSDTISIINASTNKEQVGITFNIDPPNAGSMYCNGKKISGTYYVNYDNGTKLKCQAGANAGFIFNSWFSDLGYTAQNWSRPASTLTDYLFSSFFSNQKENNNSLAFVASNDGTVNANFRSNPTTTLSVPNELYGAIYAFILSNIIPAVLVWYFGKRRKRYLSKYIAMIDATYNKFYQNKNECLLRLRAISYDIMESLRKDKITESHFQILNDRILEYINELDKPSTV